MMMEKFCVVFGYLAADYNKRLLADSGRRRTAEMQDRTFKEMLLGGLPPRDLQKFDAHGFTSNLPCVEQPPTDTGLASQNSERNHAVAGLKGQDPAPPGEALSAAQSRILKIRILKIPCFRVPKKPRRLP
jgi:hypothetical protein